MYLAIDLGSTQFKAAVFNKQLKILGNSAYTLKYKYTVNGGVELDPDNLFYALEFINKEAIKSAGISPSAIKAIAVDSQAQTFAVFDKKGRAVSPFFSWLDERAKEITTRMASYPPWTQFSHHSSFGYLLAGLQVCILKYLLSSNSIKPEKNIYFLLLPAWFNMLATGKPVVDNNIAAMSGLFSLIRNNWWDEALSDLGISSKQLPDVIPIGSCAGRTNKNASRLGLPNNIPIIMAGNDQTAGAYGAVLEKYNALLVTLGTAHVVYSVSKSLPKPAPDIIRGIYPHNLFYSMTADSCGGNIITWGANLLANGSYDTFFSLAEKTRKNSKKLSFNPEIITGGSWTNITITDGPAEFAFSIIKSLAQRVARMISTIDPHSAYHNILAAGGGSRRRIFLETISELTSRKIQVISADPLQGAARMAMHYIKHLPK